MKITPIYNKVKLLEPYKYKDILIPAGYMSNGATLSYVYYSICLLSLLDFHLLWLLVILLFVVRTPFYPSSLEASIVHDYLCEKEMYATADRYFLEILLSREDIVRAYSKWIGVRIWHIVTGRTMDKIDG